MLSMPSLQGRALNPDLPRDRRAFYQIKLPRRPALIYD